ncbi:copper chaperone PCu(A)C [Nocardiopsis oceani]
MRTAWIHRRGRAGYGGRAVLVVVPLALAAAACGGDTEDSDSAQVEQAAAEAADRGQAQVGELLIEDAWMPEPANPEIGVVYLAVTNTAHQDDAVTGVSTSVSGDADLHNTETSESGAATMHGVDEVPVPAGGTTTFVDGGYHVMVNDIPGPLAAGDGITLELTFASGAEVELDVPVQEMTGAESEHDHDHGHDHEGHGDQGDHEGHH